MDTGALIEDSEKQGTSNEDINSIFGSLSAEGLRFFQERMGDSLNTFYAKFELAIANLSHNIKESNDEWIKECNNKCDEEKEEDIAKLELEIESLEEKTDKHEEFIRKNCDVDATKRASGLAGLISLILIASNAYFLIAAGMHLEIALAASVSLSVIGAIVAFFFGRDFKYKKTSTGSLALPNTSYMGMSKSSLKTLSIFIAVVLVAISVIIISSSDENLYLSLYLAISLATSLGSYAAIFYVSYINHDHYQCKRIILEEQEYKQRAMHIKISIESVKDKNCTDYCKEKYEKAKQAREKIKTIVTEVNKNVQQEKSASISWFMTLSQKCRASYLLYWRIRRPETREVMLETKREELESKYKSCEGEFEKALEREVIRIYMEIKERCAHDEELNIFANETFSKKEETA